MVGRVDVNKIVPTAPAGTSDNRAASTAFVQSAVPVAATKAQQQAGASNLVFVTPLHQQDHDSAAKAWVNFTSAATPIINAGYNVTSVTKNATGDFTINFTTAFASASYACLITARAGANNGFGQIASGTAPTASAVRVNFITYDGGTPALFDPTSGHVDCFGRQ